MVLCLVTSVSRILINTVRISTSKSCHAPISLKRGNLALLTLSPEVEYSASMLRFLSPLLHHQVSVSLYRVRLGLRQ